MDIARLRAIARDLMEIPDMADDFRYFVGSFAVMLSDQPLTLDAAKAVMGREPDEESTVDSVTYDDGNVQVWASGSGVRCLVMGRAFSGITIGQFACLVAAAKMGESK